MERLGARIKKRRNFMQISLGDLSTQAGVSSSLLSQIENDKANPSLATIKKIAECLTTTVGELIGENEFGINKPLLNWDDKKIHKKNNKGCTVYALSEYTPNRQMEIFAIELDPSSNTQDSMNLHHGQEIFHVMKGEVDLKTDQGNVTLKKGDSYYNHFCEFRVLQNNSKSSALILWTLTPPLQNG